MGISEERSSAKKKIREEYMHVKPNIDRFVNARMRLGRTHSQALVELINEIKNRNYNVFHYASSPGSTPKSTLPSMETIRYAIRQLYNSAEELGNVLGSPHSPDPRDFQRGVRRTNLGNAVRNLGPLFSGEQSSADEENRRSWRNESLDRIRMLREHLDHRSAVTRRETPAGDIEVESRARREEVRAEREESDDEAEVGPVTEATTRKVEVSSPTEARDYTEVTSVTETRARRREALFRAKARRETEDNARRESQIQPEIPDVLSPQYDSAIPSHQYDPRTFTAEDLTFTQCLRVMSYFDFDMYYEMMRTTVVSFSLKIYGMELCELKDLQLAVYFFIEEHFNLKPTIEMCVRPIEDLNRQNAVGVLFEKIETVNHIIENRATLNNTRFSVARNYDSKWIVMNYKNDDVD